MVLPVAGRDANTQMTEDWIDASVIPVSVRDFGAKGDGATDDSLAFQAAIAYAGNLVEFFGTSLIATPTVVVPTMPCPQGGTLSFLITQTLALPFGIRIQGAGTYGGMIRFIPPGNNSTLFTIFGSTEGQTCNVTLENLFLFQNGVAQTSIAIRARNFSFLQMRSVVVANFGVGLWADWGQDISCYTCSFTGCGRGTQLGGNLAQAQTPAPPAGVRGGPGTPWLDDAAFYSCKWSQNVLDHNDLGSQVAHGCRTFLSCTFFESATTPPAGKTQFMHVTQLKSLVIKGCWFECGTTNRVGVILSNLDFDGNPGAVVAGFEISANHFLFTNSTGCICVQVVRGTGGSIVSNVFEINTGGTTTGINISDNTNTTYVGPQSWMSYPDTEIVGNLPNAAISGLSLPPGGHVLEHVGPSLATPTYSASININAAQDTQEITATNATAFTINAPTRARAGLLVISIFNNSGGALGVLTWTGGAGGFILTGGAWVQPANTLRRQITFVFNQPKNAWVEVARTAADY